MKWKTLQNCTGNCLRANLQFATRSEAFDTVFTADRRRGSTKLLSYLLGPALERTVTAFGGLHGATLV